MLIKVDATEAQQARIRQAIAKLETQKALLDEVLSSKQYSLLDGKTSYWYIANNLRKLADEIRGL